MLGLITMSASPEPAELSVLNWMVWADSHGLWDMIGTIVLVVSAAIGFSLVFWGRRRVRNLNFYVRRFRDNTNYPLKAYLEIRNYTGRSVVITMPYFVYGQLAPDPNAHGDTPSKEYEIKFPGPTNGLLSEVEYLLRHRENVSTWIPIDPRHTDAEVDSAIERQQVGKLSCMCTWLQDKPKVHKLVRRL
jgi:hypothetical protein